MGRAIDVGDDRVTGINQMMKKPATLSALVDEALLESATNNGNEHANDAIQVSEVVQNKRGGAPIADEAWALVELIQRTVHPDFWELTGGPGSIRYFAIKRVLVVRATTQVHEDLVALLRQL